MSQIEPMSIEKIKWLVARYRAHLARGIDSTTWGDLGPSLALAWAHERAKKNESDFRLVHDDYVLDNCPRVDKRKHLFGPADWLNEVLAEIGWPEDQR